MKINKNEIEQLTFKDIIMQLEKYNILDKFSSKEELEKWLLGLNQLEIHNLLDLNVDPKAIKFDSQLLIDRNLLNTLDYNKRVAAIAGINNAEGWYHLFDRMLRLEFLKSDNFYQDIETLKRAKCAQTPLWIIGESTFIYSPYHDEDFELLVSYTDQCEDSLDFVVWDAIATVAKNHDSIYSGHHRQDLKTIVKYGAKALQMSNTYPERSIHYLATNPVSLKDNYHLENMEILAQNQEIGNFLYAVMTNPNAIKKNNYRTIIREMVENKNNISYVFLVCYYAVGEEAAVNAQNILEHNYYYEIKSSYNISELLEKVDEKINTIDGDFKDVTVYEIEYNDCEHKDQSGSNKNIVKSFLRRIKK